MGEIVFGCLTPHPPLIVPEIGRGEEKTISDTINAMDQLVEIMAGCKPETCLIISPHGEYHSDAMGILKAPHSDGDLKSWGVKAPVRRFENDLPLVDLILQEAKSASIPLKSIADSRYNLDHGVMVPLHFLVRAISETTRLVPLTFSWLPLKMHYSFGTAIQKAIIKSDRKVAVIASGDMSHRLIPGAPAGYDPAGKAFDTAIVKALNDFNVNGILNMEEKLIDRAGECGLRSIIILLGILDGLKVRSKVLSYEGPFGVGYLVASFEMVQ
jgi:MEMO1 family protein